VAKKQLEVPATLEVPIVDNHTHLESVVAGMIWRMQAEMVDPKVPLGFGIRPMDLGAAEERALGQVLADAHAAGVDRVIQVGCDLPSARWTDILLQYPLVEETRHGHRFDHPHSAVLGAIAIHPNEAVLHSGIREIALDGLEPRPQIWHEIPLTEAISIIAEIAANNSLIRAIGETGMDLFRAGPQGAEAQRESFREHIAVAKELGLALQVHDREAHRQVIEILLQDGAPERTIFHCFSGDKEIAETCIQNGWYLSYAGPVTYKSNDELREALMITPLELLLVETDAPYLTPHPYRGQPNAPFAVSYTTQAIAKYRNLPLNELCQVISDNSETVYGPWD